MTPQDIPALYRKHGSLKAISRATGIGREKVRRHYAEAVRLGLMDVLPLGGKAHAEIKAPVTKQRVKALKTTRDTHHTFILTCAQNNTALHDKTWMNLLALALHTKAKLFVSRFMYVKRGLGAGNDKAKINPKDGSKRSDLDEVWWDKRITPFINDQRVEIAPGLVWCGELNILPTAAAPLSDLQTYTGRKSMVAPHTTISMESVATYGQGDGTKFNYSTGTITLRNYIQRKAGFKAEFHHCYGALLVEVDEDGDWFCRQLNADSDGVIYDLDRCVKDGEVTYGHRVEAVTGGDTHEDEKDPVIHEAKFGKGGMIDVLQPRFNFVHDLLNFARRSHHNIKDPYFLLEQHVKGMESVEDEVKGCRSFLTEIKREWMQTVVVDSNHDRHLDTWLRDNDGRRDPVNARYWSKLNSIKVERIYAGLSGGLLGGAIANWEPHWCLNNNVRFLEEDEGFITCKKYGGGIENGMHGDRGANGARGSIRGFARMGRRSNVGHSHTCGIYQGCYMAGTNSKLKLIYNHGASAWSQSDIITYPNSKRCIVTFRRGKWRA